MVSCCGCGKEVQEYWMYMPGEEDESYCENCVPRGCSCNNEYFEFDIDSIDKEQQIEFFLKRRHFNVINYGSSTHVRGQELETITDRNLIKAMFYNFTQEQLSHLEIVPLDENGRHYPCCEYWFTKDDE
jgi:hypothetical protein